MPPSLVEWLPEDHLVWTVLGAVDQMDLDRFREGYRLGAAGRAPYDPAMLVALLLYAYARGNRSSRQIERACWEDVAYKVICSMRVPDHSTIAEFRRRHEVEIAELFDQVLGLCREAGLVSVGVIMVDGTKIKANASMDQNRSYSGVVREILREAEETDRREDELYGDARGDELPEQLRTAEGRKRRLRTPSGGSRSARAARSARRSPSGTWRWIPSWCSVGVAGVVGGASGLGSRAASSSRAASARRSRSRAIERTVCSRRSVAWRRITGSIWLPIEAYERWRSGSRDTLGRVMKGNSKPYTPPTLPDGTINLSDPDSRVMRSKGLPHRQAYNVQTAVTEQQIILAAEISVDAADFGHLEPMLEVTLTHLSRHGITEQPEAVVGDAGYWHTRQIEAIADRGIEVLVPPDGAAREGNRPGWESGLFEQMREKLRTDRGRTLYALRKITIEPVFGQIKYNRRVDQFMRRGRAAVHSELRLVAATHNMLKLHNHWIANTA